MGEERRGSDDVSDGEDVRSRSGLVRIHADEARLIGFDPDLIEPESISDRTAADRTEQDVSFYRFTPTVS